MTTLLVTLLQRLGLCGLFVSGDLICGMLQVAEDFVRGRVVLLVERQEFIEHILAIQPLRMMVEAAATDHLKHRSRGTVGHAAADVASVSSQMLP